MKQFLNDWQCKGQQKKQFHQALKALKTKYNEKKSKLSTDTAITQAIMQQNKKTEKKSNEDKKSKANIKIINGSKVIQQIDHLMDIEQYEDAIFLTQGVTFFNFSIDAA